MPKVFLSHSSKDKGYVEVIVRRLGKDNIIYDALTFEEGNKAIDEILNGLNQSDIFALFISETALASDWVNIEVFNAKDKVDKNKLKIIYPVIIDKEVKFTDSRIPEWIKEYNLRYVSKPSKAAERILQKLKILSWELYPQTMEREQLFIGRHELKKKLHERLFNFDLPSPVVVIASGFKSVGRRKFLINALRDANKIKSYYKPLIFFLHSRTSIEDFILSVYDLGYTDSITREGLVNLMRIQLSEKIEIAKNLLVEIFESENKIFIVDEFSIINSDGTIVEWFRDLVKVIKNQVDSPFLFLISSARIRHNQLFHNDYIYTNNINELEPDERRSLFQALLDIESINLSIQDKKIVSEIFTGFPEQIKFAVDLIKYDGIKHLLQNLHELVDFNSEHVSKSVISYENDENAINLLVLLANYEFISINFLDKIYNGLPQEINILIIEMANKFIIENFGVSGEYLRLNDGIRDYIQRGGFPFSSTLKQSLVKHSEEALKDYNRIDNDLSEFVISIQESFINKKPIPEHLLIPSHFLLAMRELYNQRRDFPEVIKLADRVLQQAAFMDEKIIKEIKYWLCLALSRLRDKRVLSEVQSITGPDHNFILGFYYRLTRQYEKALERLETVVKEHPNFYRAKIELVIVYINIEDYDSAFVLAKENYESNKNNPYNVQYYLRTLLKKKDEVDNVDKITQQLLTQLESSPNEKALEMFYTSSAQYQAFYLHDKDRAIKTINEGILRHPKNIYPYLVKLEIGRKFVDKSILADTIPKLENGFHDSDIANRLVYLVSKVILMLLEGKTSEAQSFTIKKIRPYYPEHIFIKIQSEIDKIKAH